MDPELRLPATRLVDSKKCFPIVSCDNAQAADTIFYNQVIGDLDILVGVFSILFHHERADSTCYLVTPLIYTACNKHSKIQAQHDGDRPNSPMLRGITSW